MWTCQTGSGLYLTLCSADWRFVHTTEHLNPSLHFSQHPTWESCFAQSLHLICLTSSQCNTHHASQSDFPGARMRVWTLWIWIITCAVIPTFKGLLQFCLLSAAVIMEINTFAHWYDQTTHLMIMKFLLNWQIFSKLWRNDMFYDSVWSKMWCTQDLEIKKTSAASSLLQLHFWKLL